MQVHSNTKRATFCHCCGFSVSKALIVAGYRYCSQACYGAYARFIERNLPEAVR